MSKPSNRPRSRPEHLPTKVGVSDQRIHEAVVNCVDLAYGEGDGAVAFIVQYVQELIKQGWTQGDAEQVGSRAIGVINAMNLPPSTNW